MEKTVEGIELQRKGQKLSCGHVKSETFTKYPSRAISSKKYFGLDICLE